MQINYYELLEISQDADKETIKKAYRRLALQYHPDRNQGNSEAEAKFKLINEAYQVLSDDKNRALYDKYGADGVKAGGGFQGGFSFEDFDLGDIFSSFFGGGFGGARAKSRKAKDIDKFEANLAINLHLSFKEAVFGCQKDVSFVFKKSCAACKGSGAKDGGMQTCPKCKGHGQVQSSRGFLSFVQPCDACFGTGEVPKVKCEKCGGKGFEELQESVNVSVPEGIDEGMNLRVNGKGNILKDGTRGDLYIKLSVEEDANFIRDGENVYLEVPIFFTQAALAQKIEVPTLRGKALLELPLGVKDGDRFVLENEGIKALHSSRRGSQIVQISIKFPESLSEEQRELLKKLNESFGVQENGLNAEQKGLFDKISAWFKGE